MKGRITVLVGISGSGKSTWANEQWKENPQNTTVINRDKIRELLFGYTEGTIKEYWNRQDVFSLEKKVTRYEDTLINDALSHDNHVIVDATHLKYKYIERFKYWNVPTTIKSFTTTITEAIKRDIKRTRKVGADVIKKQHAQFKTLAKQLFAKPIDFTPVEFKNDISKIPAVIFDIDGTLAHMEGRSPYEWKRVREDKIDNPTATVLDLIRSSPHAPQILICTGRDEKAYYETKRWMDDHDIRFDGFFIRPENDMRPDWVVKEEMWRKISNKYYIVGMFDDRLQVVRRARALGLKVFNVEYNNF